LRAGEQSCGEQRVERAGNLLEVVAEEPRKRFTGEQDPRMPGEKDQEVEITGLPQTPDTVEEPPRIIVRHSQPLVRSPKEKQGAAYRTSGLGEQPNALAWMPDPCEELGAFGGGRSVALRWRAFRLARGL
jgi:hypothetical protein